MRTAWFCSQNQFCQRVLAKHWPGVPCYPDVQEVTAGAVEPVDVLCGGFPCQDISLAGKGAGLAGARSGLWSEFARLIGELEPRWVIVENVSALLGRGLSVVLADLSALGYDAEWDCIPACAVGAPHRRDRVWVVAYPNGEGEHARAVDAEVGVAPEPVADPDSTGPQGHGRFEQRPRERPAAADSATGGAGETSDAHRFRRNRWAGHKPEAHGWGEPADAGWWTVEPDVGRVANGVPARVDRLRSLGNALVPQIAEWIGRRILAWEAGNA